MWASEPVADGLGWVGRDYDLWLRMADQHASPCLVNLPRPCVYLRRHAGNTSSTQREDQAAAADSAAHRAVVRLLGRHVDATLVAAMRSMDFKSLEQVSRVAHRETRSWRL
jgi:hypothetical protein